MTASADLSFRLGVIGGLGPLASADFYRKLTELTPARLDTDHLPLVLLSIPQLPDRTQAILSGSDHVADLLVAAVRKLDALGVEAIAIPCNTAHHWFERLSRETSAELVHIVDAVLTEMAANALSGRPTAILATAGTLASGFYQHRLIAGGYVPAQPGGNDFQPLIDMAIADVKSGDVAGATAALHSALALCRAEGAEGAILACTELSVMSRAAEGRGLTIVDSNTALARASLRRLGILARDAGEPPLGQA